MAAMSISEFNRNVSAAISRVEAGEDLVLMRHGKRVVRLVKEQDQDLSARRQEARVRIRELLGNGPYLDGPATYEERTGR